MGFPPPKKWEAGTDLHLNRVIQDQQVAGGDVSDFISVIDVLSSSWENGLCEEKQQSVPQVRVPVEWAKPATAVKHQKTVLPHETTKCHSALRGKIVVFQVISHWSDCQYSIYLAYKWMWKIRAFSSPVSNIPDSKGLHRTYQNSNSLFHSSSLLLAHWACWLTHSKMRFLFGSITLQNYINQFWRPWAVRKALVEMKT